MSNLNTLSGVLDEVQEEVKRTEASKSKQHQKAFGQGVNSGRGRAVRLSLPDPAETRL